MAAHLISPKTGALVLPSGFNGLFQSFEITESVATEEVTTFGANTYGAFVSNATPVLRGTASGFAQAGAANTNPGFGGNTDNDGATGTITMETSTTISGSFIVSSIRLSESRIRGAVSITTEFMNSGDLTTTWAST